MLQLLLSFLFLLLRGPIFLEVIYHTNKPIVYIPNQDLDHEITLGCLSYGRCAYGKFSGMIDNVIILNKVASAEEVQLLYSKEEREEILGDELIINGDFEAYPYVTYADNPLFKSEWSAGPTTIDVSIVGTTGVKYLQVPASRYLLQFPEALKDNNAKGKTYRLSFKAKNVYQYTDKAFIGIQGSQDRDTPTERRVYVTYTDSQWHEYSQLISIPVSDTVNTGYHVQVQNGIDFGAVHFDDISLKEESGTPPSQPTCTDTDVNATYPDGMNTRLKGTVTTSSGSYTDECIPGATPRVEEYYCITPTSRSSRAVICATGFVCSDGACVVVSPVEYTCDDSGASNDSFTPGGICYDYYNISGVMTIVPHPNVCDDRYGYFGLKWYTFCNPTTNLCEANFTRCLNGCNEGLDACNTISCELPSGKELPARARAKVGNIIQYCDTASGSLVNVKANNQECVSDYECNSNVCIDGLCTSIREELERQGSLLKEIWCWIKAITTTETRAQCRARYNLPVTSSA